MMVRENNWYIPDSESLEAQGPFTMEQISDLVKTGKLRPDDFVWNEAFATQIWMRVYECPEFEELQAKYPKCKFPKLYSRGKANIKKLDIRYSDKNLKKENECRRFPRAPIHSEIFIHNQKTYLKGMVKDISEKGMYFEVEEADFFSMGEEVVITVFEHDTLGTFTIQCVIINETHRNGIQGYGVYFLHIRPSLKREVAKYVAKKLSSKLEAAS